MAAPADSGDAMSIHVPGASISQAPSEVALFLKSLNLQKYIDVLAANDIDEMSTLNEMQKDDFQKLGVSLGHQIKIMKSIHSRADSDALSAQARDSEQPSAKRRRSNSFASPLASAASEVLS
jgi:hypothetical protein